MVQVCVWFFPMLLYYHNNSLISLLRQKKDIERNPCVVLYTNITQLMIVDDSPWKGTGYKRKIKVNFLKAIWKSKHLLFKKISFMEWLFWILKKIKKGLQTRFWWTFFTLFFHKMFLDVDFFFSRYQTSYVIEFLFRLLMTSQTLRFIFDYSQSNGRQEKWRKRQ